MSMDHMKFDSKAKLYPFAFLRLREAFSNALFASDAGGLVPINAFVQAFFILSPVCLKRNLHGV